MKRKAVRVVGVMAFAFLLAGCVGSTVVEGGREGVWVREPWFGLGNPDAVAENHCRSFGRNANFTGRLGGGDSKFRPIRAYDCR